MSPTHGGQPESPTEISMGTRARARQIAPVKRSALGPPGDRAPRLALHHNDVGRAGPTHVNNLILEGDLTRLRLHR